MDVDDAERLRIDDAEQEDELSRAEDPGDTGTLCLIGTTVAIATYPTTAASFYGVKVTRITGKEIEGGAATLSTAGKTFLAANLGVAVPPSGSRVELTFVEHRWAFRYDG